jgi:hypothetical protein
MKRRRNGDHNRKDLRLGDLEEETQQKGRRRKESRNSWDPRRAPNRERGGAMDYVAGTFGNKVLRFQDTFP